LIGSSIRDVVIMNSVIGGLISRIRREIHSAGQMRFLNSSLSCDLKSCPGCHAVICSAPSFRISRIADLIVIRPDQQAARKLRKDSVSLIVPLADEIEFHAPRKPTMPE